MSDTHINAYHAELAIKEHALHIAQSEYDDAKKALEAMQAAFESNEQHTTDEPSDADEQKPKGKKVEYR